MNPIDASGFQGRRHSWVTRQKIAHHERACSDQGLVWPAQEVQEAQETQEAQEAQEAHGYAEIWQQKIFCE
ncbi:rCG41291 [Rattus norvegicus]|uniref:RCG41291 n=1 Tax=Rattus norvegicus TaxID=10116 RepID=A6IH65_RAT|nr:rCG41291 [Rattus norvegicus]